MGATFTITALAAGGVLALGVAGPTSTEDTSVVVAVPANPESAHPQASSAGARAAKRRALMRQLLSLSDGRQLPIRNFRVGSGFGDSSGAHAGQHHPGVDLVASTGTPIFSATDGRVIIAGPYFGYGNLVMVRTSSGQRVLYAHQSRILVRRGQRVAAGELIGRVGSTGYSTGSHLHFEVRNQRNRPVDPLQYLGLTRFKMQRLADELARLR